MTRYAANTQVSSDKSRAEIERILRRYGADSFGYGWEATQAIVMFRLNGRHIRFVLPIPNMSDDEFVYHSRGVRTASAAEAAYEQAVRQRWRALALVIKAKLEAVESGIVTFSEEFACHMVLPDGQTVGDWLLPQVDEAYKTGQMPSLLPGAVKQIGDGR